MDTTAAETVVEELSGNETPDTFVLEDVDGQVTLSEIAGVDLFSVPEKRVFKFPAGNYRWRLLDGDMTKQERKISKDSMDKKAYPTVQMKIECVDVHSITDKDRASEAQDCIGKVFVHSWVIKRLTDLGYVVAFGNDAGMKGKSEEKDLVKIFKDLAAKQFEFNCKMRVRPNPNDTDQMYINLDVPDEYNSGSVEPVQS